MLSQHTIIQLLEFKRDPSVSAGFEPLHHEEVGPVLK